MTVIPLSNICRATLPPQVIRNNFVIGHRSNYEEYLCEFVNQSEVFRSKSPAPFVSIPKEEQNHRQCDCISPYYNLDFKILGTPSSLYAQSNLSLRNCIPCEGIMLLQIPNQNQSMEVALIGNLLRGRSVEELERIENANVPRFDRNALSVEREIQAVLKTAKCEKNVLYETVPKFV